MRRIVAGCRPLYGLTYTYTGYPLVREARGWSAAARSARCARSSSSIARAGSPSRSSARAASRPEWRSDPARAGVGGCIGDIGVHAFNLAEFVTGLRVERVCADLNRRAGGGRWTTTATSCCAFENGARGVLIASQIAAGDAQRPDAAGLWRKPALDWRRRSPTASVSTARRAKRDDQVRRAGSEPTPPRRPRTLRGHPEGYLEAFANLYRDFAAVLRGERGARSRARDRRGRARHGVHSTRRSRAAAREAPGRGLRADRRIMKTIKGPAIFLAQFAGDEAPFDRLRRWPTGRPGSATSRRADPDLGRTAVRPRASAAESQAYCDEMQGTLRRARASRSPSCRPICRASWSRCIRPTTTAVRRLRRARGARQSEGAAAMGGRAGAAGGHRPRAISASTAHAHLLRRARLALSLSLAAAAGRAGRDAFDELGRRWRPILDAFDEAGVDVCFEIHPGEDLSRRRDLRDVPRARSATTRAPASSTTRATSCCSSSTISQFIDIYHERITRLPREGRRVQADRPAGRLWRLSSPGSTAPGRFRSLGDGQVDFTAHLLQARRSTTIAAGRCSNGNAPEAPRGRRARRRARSSAITSSASPSTPSTTSPRAAVTTRSTARSWGSEAMTCLSRRQILAGGALAGAALAGRSALVPPAASSEPAARPSGSRSTRSGRTLSKDLDRAFMEVAGSAIAPSSFSRSATRRPRRCAAP